MKIQLSHKFLVLIAVPLLFEICFVVILLRLQAQVEAETAKIARSKATIATTNDISKGLYDLCSDVVLSSISGQHDFDPHFDAVINHIPGALTTLETDVSQDPDELAAVKKIGRLSRRIIKRLQNLHTHVSGDGSVHLDRLEVISMLASAQQVVQNSYLVTEKEKLVQANGPTSEARARSLAEQWLIFGVLVSIILTVILALAFRTEIAKRLAAICDNAARLGRRETLGAPIGGDDEIAQLDKAFHEMAASLAKAEQTERVIIESVAEVICTLDGNGNFISISPSAATVWGYLQQDLQGQHWWILSGNAEGDSLLFGLDRRAEPFSFDLRIKRKDGTIIDTIWSGRWVDTALMFICVVVDISERARIERLKRHFLQMVSHDLKAPLSSTRIFLSSMAEGGYGELSKTLTERVKLASSDTTRLIRLVQNLLDVEKIESGMYEITREIVPFSKLVQQSIFAVQAFADNQGVAIVPKESAALLYVDEAAMIQVLVNLLSNAIKFSKKGAAVEICCDESSEFQTIHVRDHGCGIAAEERERIFDRFQTVSGSGRTAEGTGLGLSIVREIVHMHNGEVSVESELGKGTTFSIKLPRD